MSFYSHFHKKCIPEWREYYISYKVFKQLFKPFKKTTKVYGELAESKMQFQSKMYSIDSSDMGEEIDQLKVFEDKFSTLVLTETEKMDSFFQLKFMELQDEWVRINANAEVFKPYRFERSYYKKAQMLKNAFHLFYMKVNYLIQFVNLNYDALSRILRKHRKLTKTYSKVMQISELKIDTVLQKSYINQNSESLIQLRDDTTATYLDLFYHRYNKEKGVKELKALLKTRIISIWHAYFLFFFLGCTICLLVFIVVMAIYGSIDPDDDLTFKYMFPMFRGSAFIVLYIWFLGWNVYTWTRYHINYKKIFQFNYHHSTPTEILMRGTFFSSILLIVFIWYIVLNEDMGNLADGLKRLKIPKEFLPLILWVLLLAYMFFPSKKYFNGEGRRYFFIRMYRFLISPCILVDVPTGWVADQLMSFVVPLQDFAYTICYYISRIRDYDNLTPGSCFTDTIYVGFLVAFFPGLFRTIHFLHFLTIGRKKINSKNREISQLQEELNLLEPEKPLFTEKDNIQKVFTEERGETSSDKTQSSNLKIDAKEAPQTHKEMMDNASFQLKISESSSKTSLDPKSGKLKENKPNSQEKENDQPDPFIFIEENISNKNLDSPLLKEQPAWIVKRGQIEIKMQELKTLEETQNLNIMYTICLVLVMCLTISSFLYGKYPENEYFLVLWVVFAFILSTYAYYLDIVKDWALFQKNKKHPYLRERLGYQKKSFYYAAIVLDFFLRYVWVFSISPGTSSKLMRPELFIFFMGGFEMFRRVIWNFMIIEKVFVTNLESYKCLYEYQLPFKEDEIERMILEGPKKSGDSSATKRKMFSVFQSSDYEEDFKVRFGLKKRPQPEMKRGLLEDAQGVIDLKEEKKEEEDDDEKAKTACSKPKEEEMIQLSQKLNESVMKGKEVLESFVFLEKEVKNYEENLNKRYDVRRQDNQMRDSPFEIIMNCFKKKNKREPKN